jgi:hypothetical protein
MAVVQVSVEREFQGTLKSILEGQAREYREAAVMNDGSEEVKAAWRKNAVECLKVAAQLRRT